MMKIPHLIQSISDQFPYEPTRDQSLLIGKLADYISEQDPLSLFVLRGYAGTGKTTIVSSLVNVLPKLKARSVLMAPTGRAAKVLSSYSGQKAFTIHKKIYRIQTNADGVMSMTPGQNRHKDTFFIVDEASMISSSGAIEQTGYFPVRDLLEDLITYVYNQRNCRLILIGDTAQLPPVHSPDSPALNKELLQDRFGLQVDDFELREVVRQSQSSGILYNATKLREMLVNKIEDFPGFQLQQFNDMARLQGQEAADYVNNAFGSRNPDQALMICRSNKRANLYNQHIRNRVLFMEDEINAGDLLMVVKNNYFWLPADSQAGFIANGDIICLTRIRRFENVFGFRFAEVTARLVDYPDEPELECKLMLDTLHTEGPALSRNDMKKLYDEVAHEAREISGKRASMRATRENPYLNALQVKFAYAMTCHKAQGGQWEEVFVEMGFLPGKKPDTAYLRWLYTALTRATSRVFLMGFSDDFFISNNISNE